MGERVGARRFFEALDMGANTFFKSQIWGLGLFLRLKKWGHELFLACEIGGLVFFFDRKIPKNPAWIPGIIILDCPLICCYDLSNDC